MLTPGTILQNRYRIVRELGHGGLGRVYEAFDEKLHRVVALKEVIVADTEEARLAFEREASILGGLRDRALPKVFEYFTEDGRYVFVMEFISGHDLAELLQSQGNPFSQSQVMNWAFEVLRVLEILLHSQQPAILHGDIKPANLMLTRQGELVLLDFGSAKDVAASMSGQSDDEGQYGYSLFYAPIEQINGEATDPRSDLYSLGATLYRLLTGEPPKNALIRSGAINERRSDPLRPADQLNSKVSSEVAAVIHRALAIDPNDRYASAAEMRMDLKRAIDHKEPTERANEEETTQAAKPLHHRFEVQIEPDPVAKSTTPEAEKDTKKKGLPFPKLVPKWRGSHRSLLIVCLSFLCLVLLILGFFFGFRGKSVERKLEEAITRGNLFSPPNQNAYDLYRQLKESGASQEKLSYYGDRILPQLTKPPLELITQFTIAGSDDPSVNDWENAAQALNWARDLKPSDNSLAARAYYCQGRVAYLGKQEDQALQFWIRASDSDKKWPLPPNAIGLIYAVRKDYQTARRYYYEAVRRDPNWAVPYNNIGTSYYYEANYDSAKQNYLTAVRLSPHWARPHAWLGDIAAKQGNNNEAQAQYGAVLATDAVGTSSLDLGRIHSEFEKARNASAAPRASP